MLYVMEKKRRKWKNFAIIIVVWIVDVSEKEEKKKQERAGRMGIGQ